MNRRTMTVISVAAGALLVAAPIPSFENTFPSYAQAFAKRGNGNGNNNGNANSGGATRGNDKGKGVTTNSLEGHHSGHPRGSTFDSTSSISQGHFFQIQQELSTEPATLTNSTGTVEILPLRYDSPFE